LSENPLNPQKQPGNVRIRREEFSHYSGPVPPPEMLEKYNAIVPNGAERIFVMAENQSAHRQDIEKKVINSDIINARLGVIFAFIIAMTCIASAVLSAFHGYSTFGGFLGTGGLIGLVATFIYGTKSRKEERQRNSQSSKQTPE